MTTPIPRHHPTRSPSRRLLRAAAAAVALLPVLPPMGYADEAPASGLWPLDAAPAVVARFDPPAERWQRGHRGVDLQGRVGQPVRAAMAGTVTFAGPIAGTGVVVVDHGATRTTYQPVVSSVSRGQEVAAGALLGRLTWTGTHCLPRACLHWGWLRGGTYLDPLQLVDAPQPVRLLPLEPSAPSSGWPGGGFARTLLGGG